MPAVNLTLNDKYNPRYTYNQIAASTLIQTGNGLLGKIFVSAIGTTPTITVYDNTAGSGTVILATFTPTANQSISLDIQFKVGLYVAIGGSGTTNITVIYR